MSIVLVSSSGLLPQLNLYSPLCQFLGFGSYRSELIHEDIAKLKSSLPRCVDLIPKDATLAEAVGPGEHTVRINPAHYDNCQFQLDSPEEDKKMSEFALHKPALTLRNCLITYKGGNIELHLGMWPLAFENCVFDFSPLPNPPAPVQKITETLLATNPEIVPFPAT